MAGHRIAQIHDSGPAGRAEAGLDSVGREARQRRRREVLAEVAAQLLSGQDIDRVVMPALFRALSEERMVDATLGYIVTDVADGLKLGFMEGFDPAMVQRCLTLDFGQAICGRVAQSRQAMSVSDIQRTLDPAADLVRAAGIDAYACEPLIVGGRLLGTLSFASRSRRRFTADDLAFFRAIAKHVAIARDRQASIAVAVAAD